MTVILNRKCKCHFDFSKLQISKFLGSIALHENHKDLQVLKSELRKKYGLLIDARRWLIGDFNLELGICDNRGGCLGRFTLQVANRSGKICVQKFTVECGNTYFWASKICL